MLVLVARLTARSHSRQGLLALVIHVVNHGHGHWRLLLHACEAWIVPYTTLRAIIIKLLVLELVHEVLLVCGLHRTRSLVHKHGIQDILSIIATRYHIMRRLTLPAKIR